MTRAAGVPAAVDVHVAECSIGELPSCDVTDDQILKLRGEAAEHGDMEMVATCDLAMRGDGDARFACADAIADSRAMGDR